MTMSDNWNIYPQAPPPYDPQDGDLIDADERAAWKLLAKEIFKKPKSQPRPPVVGFVYVLQSPTGAYKIGCTVNPENRLRTFNVKLPFEVEFVCLIPSNDAYALEKRLHSRFGSQKINGEWFNLSERDLTILKRLAKSI